MSQINQLNDIANRVSKRNEEKKIESEYLKTKNLMNMMFEGSSILSKIYVLLVSMIQSDITRDEISYKETKEKFADVIVDITNEKDYTKLGLFLKVLAKYGGYAYIFYKQHSFMFDDDRINLLKDEYLYDSTDGSFIDKYNFVINKYQKFLGNTLYNLSDIKETLMMLHRLSAELEIIKDKIDRNLYLEYAIDLKEKIDDLDMLMLSIEEEVTENQKKIIN